MRYRQAKTADAPAIAEVHVASWRTTYRGLLPDQLLAGLSVEVRADQWSRQLDGLGTTGTLGTAENSVIYVAESDSGMTAASEPGLASSKGSEPGAASAPGDERGAPRVVGFASAGPEREEDCGFDGELYAIYVLADHQGAGVGRELMRRAADFLRRRDCTSMRVWVLAGNPVERFYQRLGGVKVGEKPIAIGERGDDLQLPESLSCFCVRVSWN